MNAKRKVIDKNYGLEILRMILCFWVLLFHCLNKIDYPLLLNIIKMMYHVPSFFFISFYFLFPVIKDKIMIKMKSRLQRLSIPYIFWPIISWTFNNINYKIYKQSRFGRLVPLSKLVKQIIIGRVFYVPFWFQFNLIFLTLIFFILSKLLKIENFLKLTKMIAILSYFFQYSRYIYIFFDNYNTCISRSLGGLVESFPIAVSAFILNSSNLLKHLKNSRYTAIFYSLVINIFICKYNIFKKIEIYGDTYKFNGLDKNIFSFCIFLTFFLIPFEKIKSKKITKFIIIVTNHTFGIYCLHPIIKFYLLKLFHILPTLKGCVINYITCYLISFIGLKLSFNSQLKFLFI